VAARRFVSPLGHRLISYSRSCDLEALTSRGLLGIGTKEFTHYALNASCTSVMSMQCNVGLMCLKCSDISKLVNLQYERYCVFNVQ